MEFLGIMILAAVSISATTIAAFIGGLLQPYLQEALLKNNFSGKASLLATAVVSFLIALFSTYVVGGFAQVSIPAFTLTDISPLLTYFWPIFAQVFALSQLVFHGTESTPADPHAVAKTTPTPPA